MLKHARRATIALTTSALLTIGLTTGQVAQAVPADVSPKADQSADWLSSQLREGLVKSEYNDGKDWVRYVDYGLTLDFFYAFEGLGVRPAVRQEILDAVEPRVEKYLTPFGSTYAGAAGKLLSAVQTHGIDPSTYGEGDLLPRLESMVHTAEDSELGRARGSEADGSSTLSQSFVAEALAAAGSELTDEVVSFLLQQQCDEGYFRVYLESADHTCDGGTDAQSGPSVDATAAAVLSLLKVRGSGIPAVDVATVDAAVASAVSWLVVRQKENGAFAEDGIANSNSTGLAGWALHEAGEVEAAARAAEWLDGLRVTKRLIRRTAFVAADRGAVAFSKPALAEGRKEGITRDARYVWRRSTAQAAVALNSPLP